MCSSELKNQLKSILYPRGACLLGVADPRRGFEYAQPGHGPLEVMHSCRSVVVLGVAAGGDMDYFVRPKTHGDAAYSRISYLLLDSLLLSALQLLEGRGFETRIPSGIAVPERSIPIISYKLCAYEAGLGVYGRFGAIVTPQYGPRVNWGVILTDAELEADRRLEGFEPCKGCTLCAKLCPVKAIDEEAPPPTGYDRDRCFSFIMGIRDYYASHGEYRGHCGICYDNCPAGMESPSNIGFVKIREAGIGHEAPEKAAEISRAVLSSESYLRRQAEALHHRRR